MKTIASLLLLACLCSTAATLSPQWAVPDDSLARYFERRTRELSERCLGDVTNAAAWQARAPKLRAELAEMLGLDPLPARTDLKATTTGRLEHEHFTVENLHFQSLPGFYVTANLYLPKNAPQPAPAVLYVCGHGPVISNGVSYGNKVSYQHHGAWFARNGYVCLVIDTLQLGEIQGLHHGMYREGMWWWNARGYTPAGVEAWNSMRALDYLSTRPEVDTNRFAVTGRSGGGAYSWFLTAMDDRIKAAAPVAGITDLENHVVDGAVEGHCDCMYFVNTHQWDYAALAALVAPRPLLLCNTDTDSIFPLDGVVRLHAKVRGVYEALNSNEKLGLVITPGGHKDTQELQVPVMRWFNRHLKREESAVVNAAEKYFRPEQLKVFQELPGDALNTNIHFSFVKAASASVPKDREDWQRQREAWMRGLREKSFAAWPEQPEPARFVNATGVDDGKSASVAAHVASEPDVLLPVRYVLPAARKPARVVLRLSTSATNAPANDDLVVIARTRGDWPGDARKQTQLRRRFSLLGTTADAMRVWDIVRIIETVRAETHREFGTLPVRIEAEGSMAVNAIYAALFASIDELILSKVPASHMHGPDYLNVLKILDVPQALAMAAEKSAIELRGGEARDWNFAVETARRGGFERNLKLSPNE
jgi:dienelactone hydrolase